MKSEKWLLTKWSIPCLKYGMAAALLGGCGAVPRDFSDMPTARLCTEYLSLPSYNIFAQARDAEVRKRGVDCSPYATAAAIDRASREAMMIEGLKMMQPPPAPAIQPPPPPIRCVTTYIGNQAITRCN